MTRISKQAERRKQNPKKHKKVIFQKTGSKSDRLPLGYKEHINALEGDLALSMFIPKITKK